MPAKRLGWNVWKSAFELSDTRKPYLHLERANSRGICHCHCERALVAAPDQMDCPWCGCGWLFSCMMCGKAFTYAKPVLINQPLEGLVERDMLARGWKHDAELFKEATAYLAALLSKIEEGREYVYLDGAVVPLDSRDVELNGIHSHHKLKSLPHADELKKPGTLDGILGDGEYWFDRAHPEPDDGNQEDDV